MASSRKGKISELYDLAAIEKQQETVIKLVGDLVNTINQVKPVAVNLAGTEKTKEVIDGMKKVSEATQQVNDISGKAVNAMGQLVDMSKKAAGSYEQQANLITKFAGTLDQNIKLQTQYKIRLEEISKAIKEQKSAYAEGQTSAEQYGLKLAALTKEQTELKTASSELGFTIRSQVKESQAAQGSYDQLRQRLGLLRDAHRQLSDEEKASGAGMALKVQIDALRDATEKESESLGNFQHNVGNYSGALGTLNKAMTDVKAKIDQMNQSGEVNESVMQQLQKEYAILSGVVENQQAGFVSMRQEIQGNEIAIEQLIKVYGADSEIVRKLIKENGDLRDSFKDLKATQKAVGSDTFAFDALLQGGQALVGMYSAAQGAAALFGDENQDLQKTFVKLQASMALVQGAQAVVNALQKESALVQGILAVRTGIATAATRVYTFVTAGATAAARTFNATLVASGIGVALLLISQVASAMNVFGDNTKDATTDLQNFNEELEFSNQLLQDMNDSIDFDTKIAVEKLKQVGASQGQITKREIEGIRQRIANNKLEIQSNKDKLDTITGSDEKAQEAKQKLIERGTKLEKENIKLAGEIVLKGEQDKTRIAEDGSNKRKQAAEKSAAENKQRQEAEFKAAFDLQKYYAEKEIAAQKAMADDSNSPNTVRYNALLVALDKEEKLAAAQRDHDLKNQKLTESERALIIKKAEDEILKLRTDAAGKLIQIQRDSKDSINGILNERTKLNQDEANKQVDVLINNLQKQTDEIQKAGDKQLALDLNRYSAGEINKEEYERRKLAIENRVRKESLLAEIDYYEKLIKISNVAPDKAAEAEKKLADLRKELNALGVKDTEDSNAKKAESDKAYHEALRDRLKELGNEIKDTVFSLLEGGIDRQKNQIQDQMDLLDVKTKKEIDAVDQTTLSEQDKAAKIAIINAKAQAQKEALEKRQRQLDEQKARFEKAKAVAEIIQNTTIAVVKTLAEYPGPHGIILAAIIGALGAAQLIKTLATPIPHYAEGTEDHPGGYAVVGDAKKSEYVQTPDGEIHKTPATDTLVNMPKHSKVFKDETALMNRMMNQHLNTSLAIKEKPNDYYQFQNITAGIDRMRTDVVKAVKNIPQPVFDKNGLKQVIHGKGSVQEYIKGL